MKIQKRWASAFLVGLALLLAAAPPAAGQSKEKVYRSLTPAQVESILNEMGIKFATTQPPSLPEDFDFDFERNNYKIRLTLSKGKRLWISAFFPKAALEKINQWNINAKFSRAVLDRVKDREYAIIEYQMDAFGGTTDNMLKQFIRRFDNEVSAFEQFVRNN
jgi:Putative bacterial sensory transduction regulator